MPDPREQAEAVARWCGWKHFENRNMPWRSHCGVDAYRLPPFADSLDTWPPVEALLAERGLLRRYREELESMWRADDMGMDRAEYLIRASAAQRLAAAARVIEEVERAG